MPAALQTEPEIVKAFTRLDVMYFEEKEREIYEIELKARRDDVEELRTAKEKGREEGEAIGIEKGEAAIGLGKRQNHRGRAEGEAHRDRQSIAASW